MNWSACSVLLFFGLLIAVLSGYLLGSIPFSLLVARLSGVGDIRNVGSGNVGATNVMRAGGLLPGAVSLLLDGGKGALAVCVQGYFAITSPFSLVAGMAAVVGHVFPVWLRFSGGKGVATFLGAMLAFSIPLSFVFAASWLTVFYLFSYSSMASITAVLAVMVSSSFVVGWSYVPVVVASGALILYKHKDNLRRFLNGEEKKLKLSGNNDASQ